MCNIKKLRLEAYSVDPNYFSKKREAGLKYNSGAVGRPGLAGGAMARALKLHVTFTSEH